MPLSHRPATPQDLDACWCIVRGDPFYPPTLRETRTAFWRRLMAEEAVLSVVVKIPSALRRRACAPFPSARS